MLQGSRRAFVFGSSFEFAVDVFGYVVADHVCVVDVCGLDNTGAIDAYYEDSKARFFNGNAGDTAWKNPVAVGKLDQCSTRRWCVFGDLFEELFVSEEWFVFGFVVHIRWS